MIRQFVDERYPGIWQPSTLTTHLYGARSKKSYIHHPHAKRFLYKNADGTFALYDEGSHGPNIWTPDEAEDIGMPRRQRRRSVLSGTSRTSLHTNWTPLNRA